ncbi:hypothetical protein A0O28_0087650 [Trichoderma guizhouense]|uniref:Histidinolphosphatase-like protein n=1 Tax=Trichoderma guizhouense TaxID=1491466 RepID=A0A1T3CPW2_9HYPO|nr:hypothetical protein A0O28_0087650 [Trichoderma guizhouense]
MAEPSPTIALKLPSKYSPATSDNTAPTVDWLSRTWSVTHSTLSMWRAARNVRITYKPLPPKADGRLRIDDLVEYEPSDKAGALKSVAGVDTQSPGDGGWDWRGKGWLFFVGSHWELLGWGEETLADGRTERWAVTWFAPTLFTKEGLDIYSDQREGLSEATYGKIDQALRGLDAKPLVDMVAQDMKPVEIKLPWTEK